MIARSELHWLEEASMFFEKKGPVWDAVRELVHLLEQEGIDYVVIGGIALNVHNYPRQTTDVDIVLAPAALEEFRRGLGKTRYTPTEGRPRRFVDPVSEVNIDILVAGTLAGRRSKNSTVRFPHAGEAEIHGDLRTVSLARLIELKLVTWRHKDWGDVVELIRRNSLTEDFAERLDPTIRTAFGECYDEANHEEYDEPGGGQ